MSGSGKKKAVYKKPIIPKEIEILELVSEGDSNREIGEKLFISTGTVKWHINHILEKLHVNNRIQAANKAKESNLL